MVIVSLKSSVEGSAVLARGTSDFALGARLECSLAMGFDRRKAQGKLDLWNFPKPCKDV